MNGVVENVVQTGHIIIAVCTLLGFLGSAIGLFFGVKVAISKAIYDIAAIDRHLKGVDMKLDATNLIMNEIRIAQNTVAVRGEAIEKRVDLAEKHLDTIDNRLQAAQRAISDVRLENRDWHNRPPRSLGAAASGDQSPEPV